MNDHILSIRWTIEGDGGLANCDVLTMNHRLNTTPMGALKYAYPIKAFAKALAEHGPKPR
jgi:hypothetical protein